MSYRVLLPAVLATAGCVSLAGFDNAGPGIDDVEFRITQGIGPDGDAVMHIAPDGTATRVTLQHGTERADLDRATLDELHARLDAAQFETLAPHYGCTGICVLPASPLYHVAVRLDDGAHEVEVESYFLIHQPDRFPAPLVAVMTSLRDIFDHAQWR
jgi:hypothetical protein